MIDREIQDALKVDPPPEFVARVRMRIANEPAPSSWRWSWTVAAGVACAAAIVIAVAVSRPGERVGTQAFPPPQVADLVLPSRSTPIVPERPAQGSTPAIAVAVATAASGFSRTRIEPEVLLDPAETRVLQGLIAGVRDGRIDLAAAANASAATAMELAPVADIVIPPITIDPLTPSGDQGARQ